MSEEKKPKEEKQPERALVTMGNAGGLMPADFNGLWRIAEIFASSGLMPRGMERPETVFTAIEMGLEVGLKAMQAVQNIAVINGRPSLWGDALLGLVEGSGLLEDFAETYEGEWPKDDFKAVCVAKRRGRSVVTRNEFSIADAKLAGLWNKEGPWKTYPKRMLKARARGFTLRDGFADVLKGLKSAEEVMDTQEDFIDISPGTFTPLPEQPKGLTLDEFLDEYCRDDSEHGPMKDFLKATADTHGMSIDGIIAKILETEGNLDEFLAAFGKWVEKQKKADPAPSESEASAAPATPQSEEKMIPPEDETPVVDQGPRLASPKDYEDLKTMLERKEADKKYKMDAPFIIGALAKTDGGDLTVDTFRAAMTALSKKPPAWKIFDHALGIKASK